nr:TIGR03905 family TSCPD domain-containing protein [uncultured Gemmiger sp.]
MLYERKNKGTCSVLTRVDLADDHTIRKVEVLGGCNGNLKGICKLLEGMKAEDAIQRMRGTTCGPRPTSCPDQISHALEEALVKLG